jgi:hypothetical protein
VLDTSWTANNPEDHSTRCRAAEDWRRRAAAAASTMSLFDDSDARRPDFEVVPWRFQYDFRCSAQRCTGHTQTIVDWEALAL